MLYAQNEEDVLRYSFESLGGTARNMGMGGAMSAIGGDFSAVLQNPAAMGKFNRNNFSFTPYINQSSIDAHYNGNSTSRQRTNLKLGNISLLKSYELNRRQSRNWVSVQLGAGFNRTQTFNETFSYSGKSETSIIDYFIAEAEGTSENNLTSVFGFSSGLAYLTYAIDPILNDDGTTSYTTNKTGAAQQSRSVETEGGMGEFNFAMSGNFRNKLLVGGSLNIATLSYYTRFDHTETFDTDASFINSINYNGYIDASGSGLNLRVGAIFMPLDFIRIGAAIETPTRLSMSENFGNDMITYDDISENSLTNNPAPPTGSFDYIIRTPLKANFSLGFIYKKLGSISAEIEMVDYSSAHIKSHRNSGASFYSFASENAQIENLYTTAYNLKVGAEARITPNLYLRGGYANFLSAYKSEKGIIDSPIEYYTGGIGYNFGDAYFDFAVILKESHNEYYAYLPTMDGSMAKIDKTKSQYVLTLGFRF